jgi:5S rRNA maturation endonuclease (ribonuclease M5)
MEAFDVDETRRFLCSERVTERATGRQRISEILKVEQHSSILVDSNDWGKILAAALSGEVKEADHHAKKRKELHQDIAACTKRIIKHIIQNVHDLPHKQLRQALGHALTVLQDTNYSIRFRSEYRAVLSDLLEPSLVHTYKSSYFDHLINYLKFAIEDGTAIRVDPADSKVLKTLCKGLFMDKSEPNRLFSEMLSWCGQNLLPSTTDNIALQSAITASFADCAALYLSYHGPSSLDSIRTEGKVLVQHVVRQISLNRLRDLQRDAYIRFIYAYFGALNYDCKRTSNAANGTRNNATSEGQIHSLSRLSVLPGTDPLYNCLEMLCEALTTDECLRSLTVYAYNQVNNNFII